MSRAFVKEHDGDGVDELPELAISTHRNLVTPDGLAQIEAHARRLTAELAEARATLDHADVNDDTVYCANAVNFSDGTLGAGELAHYDAPAGASEISAFAMNLVAMKKHADRFEEYGQMLIDRALDIARGGNGRVEAGKNG